MFKSLNRGVSAPIAITIIIVLAVAFIGGILAYQYWWLPEKIVTPTPTPTPDETADWKTYTNTQSGFSIKYPSSWESPFGHWAGGWTAGKLIDNNNYCVTDVGSSSVSELSNQGEISDLLGKGYLQTSIKIGGIDGIRLARNPLGAGLTEAVYFTYKGNDFRIGRNRGFGDEIENECINIFDQILSTFKFLE